MNCIRLVIERLEGKRRKVLYIDCLSIARCHHDRTTVADMLRKAIREFGAPTPPRRRE